MLTDEEIKNIWESLPRDRFPAPEFARDIERAVMKKLGEQEPVEWQYLSTVGGWSYFSNEKHKNDTIEDGRWPIRALYAHPLLAQAVPAKQYDIDLIHRAARHLEVVMDEHPYCDHVQVVKHFADIRLNERSISAAPKP